MLPNHGGPRRILTFAFRITAKLSIKLQAHKWWVRVGSNHCYESQRLVFSLKLQTHKLLSQKCKVFLSHFTVVVISNAPYRSADWIRTNFNLCKPYYILSYWWSDGESNPDFLRAKQMCSRYHYRPINLLISQVQQQT